MSKVTVMMPVFNGSEFIAEAIETVRAQTFADWELLVVDDGSTDNTLEIVKTFADGRINILYQYHQGEGAARNTALRAAAGDYIAFLDSDDWFLPDALSLFVAYLDHNPEFDVLYSDGFKCDVDGQTLARFSDTKPSNPVGNVLEDMTIHPLHGGVCATAFRKNFALEHGLWFDESLKLATDWDFFIRMAEHGHFGYTAEPTCRYRLHAASISATLPDDRQPDDRLLFDLSADPGETVNVYGQNPQIEAYFERILQEHLEQVKKTQPAHEGEGWESDEEVLRRLRDLGYLD